MKYGIVDYYDQSHFTREFKEFSGLSVNRYFTLFNEPDNPETKIIRELILTKDHPVTITA
jgi:AraC-like DNA-binding protein